jgi:predicted solute-binding protein
VASVRLQPQISVDDGRWNDAAAFALPADAGAETPIQTIDLGDAWTRMTGLPFVYAFWAGRPGVLTAQDVAALKRARDEGIRRPDELARQYLADTPERQALGAEYLRDKIKYHFGDEERAGLEAFYRYAVEAGVVPATRELSFF